MLIPAQSRLVMIGDSVTDCGRARPVGRGPGAGLGDGYVSQVDAFLRVVHPTAHLEILNLGISGNTVRDLAARWPTDVLALAPAWLSVMIGINDVWRQFDADPARRADAVLPEEFESVYDALLARTVANLGGLVLMTPFYVQADRGDPMRARMDDYGAIVARLARRYDAVFVDTQAAFERQLTHEPYDALAADRVHPNAAGHFVLAHAFLGAIGAR